MKFLFRILVSAVDAPKMLNPVNGATTMWDVGICNTGPTRMMDGKVGWFPATFYHGPPRLGKNLSGICIFSLLDTSYSEPDIFLTTTQTAPVLPLTAFALQ